MLSIFCHACIIAFQVRCALLWHLWHGARARKYLKLISEAEDDALGEALCEQLSESRQKTTNFTIMLRDFVQQVRMIPQRVPALGDCGAWAVLWRSLGFHGISEPTVPDEDLADHLEKYKANMEEVREDVAAAWLQVVKIPCLGFA
jgi:hypothetical protein